MILAFLKNSSVPSFKLIEFTIALPEVFLSPSSITAKSDESIIIGTFAIKLSFCKTLKKFFISSTESKIPSSTCISKTFAPASICCLATSRAFK